MYTLKVRNIVKKFKTKGGEVFAVDNVSFSVKRGEIFGLLGVNGAGKSTTINMLTGLMSPDSGSIEMFGLDFETNEEECKSRFNLATAYYHLDRNLTVLENLKVYSRLYGVKNFDKKIADLVEMFMLKDRLHTRVKSLSSGENSRVVLIKGLLNDPELLFLDECTVGLDPDMAQVTREHLRKYNKETGCTIIFTSHYMQEVEQLCDRIAFMDSGKIVKVGKAVDLLKELKLQRVRIHLTRGINVATSIMEKGGAKILSSKNNEVEFLIKNEKRVLFGLLKQLVDKKIIFDDLHVFKPTLEDYFISKSRKKK